MASGVWDYSDFGNMVGRPTFLALTDTALACGAWYRQGWAISRNLAHLVREYVLLRLPTDWWGPAVKSASRGLADAEEISPKFAN